MVPKSHFQTPEGGRVCERNNDATPAPVPFTSFMVQTQLRGVAGSLCCVKRFEIANFRKEAGLWTILFTERVECMHMIITDGFMLGAKQKEKAITNERKYTRYSRNARVFLCHIKGS